MKLTQIQTHEDVFIPGVGSLKKTINAGPDKTLQVVEGVGVKVSMRGKFALVPWSNIKTANGIEEQEAAARVS